MTEFLLAESCKLGIMPEKGIAKILLANRLGNIETPETVQELIALVKVRFKQ